MMETAAAAGGGGPGYADSVESSPRSRGGDSWDEPAFPSAAAGRLRLMCSYGGRIVPRPTDKSLCYLGGETRIVVVDRHSSLPDLSAKLSRNLLGGRPFSLKYQLPNEDLDSLISVATDEDLDNMIEEYDRILAAAAGASGGSNRSSRLRLFLFPSKSESSPTSSIGSLLDDSKSETWFVDALNSAMGGMGIDGLPRGLSSDSASVNCLLGLEDDSSVHSHGGSAIASSGVVRGGAHSELPERLVLSRPDSSGKLARHSQDVHSIPDSPMLDTTSSFGSASSVPSLSNLPPIRVRPDDRPSDPRIAGLDDHFAQMNLSSGTVAAGGGQRADDNFKEPSYAPELQPSPPIPPSASSASTLTISPTENPSKAFSSDDEKSDHGGVRKPLQHRPPDLTQIEALSYDSGSRTMYLNATSDPKRELPVSSDPSNRVPILATDAAGYQLPSLQPKQFHEQQLHPQFHHQQQQQQQQQQYIPANPHYIHHPATGGVIPVPSYFPVATHTIQQPPQAHAYDPQMPLYYYPVRQTPSYDLAAMQPGLGDPNLISSAAKPALPVPRVPAKPELPANLYRTNAPSPATALQPPLIHVAADQAHPYATGMGYHVVQPHHISQSPATMVNYGYDFAGDRAHPQMYYSQATPLPVSSGVVIADGTAPADAKATRAS
ncbi:leucine-rich repeat extensin-like protein 2 [Musa acuminata AAA Group]|uniref:leucine-rich repeat extensin-like protein 2 n=1 Tax=Musa acuminata AAA Group TaxID=214697 RepID=UPI0031D3F197